MTDKPKKPAKAKSAKKSKAKKPTKTAKVPDVFKKGTKIVMSEGLTPGLTKKAAAIKSKVKKSIKKAEKKAKEIEKAKPKVFKRGEKVEIWQNDMPSPEAGGIPFCVRHLDNLQIKYVATTLTHIQAELELLIDARNAEVPDYVDTVSSYISDRLGDLMGYLKEQKVIV